MQILGKMPKKEYLRTYYTIKKFFEQSQHLMFSVSEYDAESNDNNWNWNLSTSVGNEYILWKWIF